MKLAVAIAAVLVVPLSSQSLVVVPPALAGIEASGATNVPLGRAYAMRTQFAYDGPLIGWSGSRSISTLRFRADGASASSSKKVELQLWMSTMTRGVNAIGSSFTANRGTDHTEVMQRSSLVLPSLVARTASEQQAGPAPFTVSLPFDRSFAFDPGKGSLLVDLLVHQQSRGSYLLDCSYVGDAPFVYSGPAGCGYPNAPALRVEPGSAQIMVGARAALRLANASPGRLAILMFGTKTTGTWQGLSLPFDAAPIGARGCSLSVDIQAMSRCTADSLGSALFDYQIPDRPALKGFRAVVQGLAESPGANPLGATTSQAVWLEIGALHPVARVYTNDLSATLGQVEIGVAPVLAIVMR